LSKTVDPRQVVSRIEETKAMSIEVVTSAVQVAESNQLALRNGFHLEPRCRVCRNDEVRAKVNGMLAVGASYASIVRVLGHDDSELDRRDRVTIDSVRNHCARHFPVQSVAKASYRAILERRAEQNGVDFINGVVTAITPMAFLETVMVRGYETLVDPDTKVDVNTGMIAAGRLQSLIDSHSGQPDLTQLRLQVYRIQDAVKAVVPQEMWSAIVERLDQPQQHPEAIDAETEDFDDEEDGYDPTEFTEEDDES
jgi:hypothetical protein